MKKLDHFDYIDRGAAVLVMAVLSPLLVPLFIIMSLCWITGQISHLIKPIKKGYE